MAIPYYVCSWLKPTFDNHRKRTLPTTTKQAVHLISCFVVQDYSRGHNRQGWSWIAPLSCHTTLGNVLGHFRTSARTKGQKRAWAGIFRSNIDVPGAPAGFRRGSSLILCLKELYDVNRVQKNINFISWRPLLFTLRVYVHFSAMPCDMSWHSASWVGVDGSSFHYLN